jgi:ketosteroid isomerase-like protein
MPAHRPEEIHALIADALNAGDTDAFDALHEDCATIVVPSDGRRVSGREEIHAALEEVFALAPTVQIECVDKLESDGLALTHGDWRLAGSRDGHRVAMAGRGTIVSRRQPDGTWQIVFDNPLSHAQPR